MAERDYPKDGKIEQMNPDKLQAIREMVNANPFLPIPVKKKEQEAPDGN